MADTKKTESTSQKGCGDSSSDCCSGIFEEISKWMKKFCGDESGSSDCREKMQKMCCGAPEGSTEQ